MDLYQTVSIAGAIILGILVLIAIVKSRNVVITDGKK